MMNMLSEEEKLYFSDLEAHFTHHVSTYAETKKAQLEAGERGALENERTRLSHYLELVGAAAVSDVLTNIKYKAAKLSILNDLLTRHKPIHTSTTAVLNRRQLKQLAQACKYMYNEHTNTVLDAYGFVQKLLGTLHNDRGEQISRIQVHLAITGDVVDAYFNDHNARLASEVVELATLKLDPSGKSVLQTRRPLSDTQKHQAYVSLSRHLLNYS